MNCRPHPYQGCALPTELSGQNFSTVSPFHQTARLSAHTNDDTAIQYRRSTPIMQIGFIYLERVMGIEPTYSAWKAEVLPLNYTRAAKRRVAHQYRYKPKIWWRGEDSNLRRRSRQIYSLIPLATREPLQKGLSPVYTELNN